jgi:hypothetical protein
MHDIRNGIRWRPPYPAVGVGSPECHSCSHEEDGTMQKFLIERELPGAGRMSPAEFKQVARKSVNVLRELGTDIQWVHSYVTGDKLYCVYLAEDAEIIREHARLGGFPCNNVSAIECVLDPVSAG